MTYLKMLLRKDILFAVLMFAIIIVMIVPINRVLMDVLIALNFTISITIFMTAIYIRSPLGFVTFPSVILVATCLRIGLSVATTRLILTTADAGDIIKAFGKFAVASNVVVGMIIFLIITIVQFIVITKGAERIAEVGARFKLDALPGRQMSIEAEAKSGDMSRDEMRIKRALLSEESQFFGSMDGAMKFVKGDAIAGLIITIVNLIGGILVGAGQLGMSFGEAVSTFSLLTVGDGLVAQIPALFIALSAGAIVTRASKEDSSDLGTEIAADLMGEPQALYVGAVIIFVMGLLPGFPTLIFTAFAASLLIISRFVMRTQAEQDTKAEMDSRGATAQSGTMQNVDRYRTVCGERLFKQIDEAAFVARRSEIAQSYTRTIGFDLPFFGIGLDPNIGPDKWEFRRDSVPVLFGSIPADSIIVIGDINLAALAAETPTTPLTMPNGTFHIVPADRADMVKKAGLDTLSPAQVLADAGFFQIALTAGILFDQIDLEIYLEDLSRRERVYFDTILENVDRRKIAEIIGYLLIESIPIVPREAFLDSLAFLADQELGSTDMAENMRYLLRRQICYTLANEDNVIGAYIIDRGIDTMVQASLPNPQTGAFTPISVERMRPVLVQMREVQMRNEPDTLQPTIIISNESRRALRAFLVKHKIYLPVLAQRELAEEFTFEPLGLLRAGPPPEKKEKKARPS